MPRAILVVVILSMILAPTIPQLQAVGQGYLAIQDYLGTIWTMDDIEKIINYYYTTSDGETKSLADYFWIVVDDNPDNKYSLRDFIASPIDGKTAVLPLPAGDHYVDIYWFGYHQRVLVNIVENQHYVLNLETAPVVPFKTAGEPPSSAEWDLAANPEGLTIQRRDGKAWVRFNHDQSFITVAWYDEDTGWNYQSLDIYIDTSYQYAFHINDPSNPEYYEEKTGSFLWLSWDIYKVKEIVKWNRTGEILHVAYIVAIGENEAFLRGGEEMWSAVGRNVVEAAMKVAELISPIKWTINYAADYAQFVQGYYDTWMGMIYASKYQKTVLLVWDVFVTPTQIIVLAHAYDVQQDGTIIKKPVTSVNAFTINNRLFYIKQLSGGAEYVYTKGLTGPLETRTTDVSGSSLYTYVKCSYSLSVGGIRGYDENNPHIYMPCGQYFKFRVDDLSKYDYNIFIAFKHKVDYEWDSSNGEPKDYAYTKYNLQIQIIFDDTDKADLFEQRLISNDISYTREDNAFTLTVTSNSEKQMPWNSGGSGKWVDEALYFVGLSSMGIDRLIPQNSSGYFSYKITGYMRATTSWTEDGDYDWTKYYIDKFRLRVIVIPKMTPPQISLLKDGYQTVSGAFAVQVYTTLFREDSNAYLLGYYLLGSDPPPSFIIRDVHYDIENDLMHYVWTIITADAYGQDLVTLTSKYNESTHILEWELSLKPTVRTYDGVVIALFDYNRMAFLNLAPDIIEYLLAVPPNQGGYGTPIIDWSTVSVYSINFSRPYELYYYDKSSGLWVCVKTEYINDTMTWNILRYADNVQVETLEPGDMSQYYYKLIYTDTNQTLKGWLLNQNGTLKIITGQVTWSLSDEELKKILQEIQLKGIYDRWLEQWNEIARKLGLITDILNKIGGAWDWLNQNWKWLLLGLGGLLLLVLLLLRQSGSKIVVAGRFK